MLRAELGRVAAAVGGGGRVEAELGLGLGAVEEEAVVGDVALEEGCVELVGVWVVERGGWLPGEFGRNG